MFSTILSSTKTCPIPAFQNHGIDSKDCEVNNTNLYTEEQHSYESTLGVLIYLVKHSRPDINNDTRELSKDMYTENQSHVRFLYRCVKYVSSTKEIGLKLQPKLIKSENFHLRQDSTTFQKKHSDEKIHPFGCVPKLFSL